MFGMVKDLCYEKNEDNFLKIYSRIEKYENISDRMEIEIANYLTFVAEGRLSSEGKEEIRIMLRTVTEIESIADSCNNLEMCIRDSICAVIDLLFYYNQRPLSAGQRQDYRI